MRDKIQNILEHLSKSLEKNKDLFYDAEEIWTELETMGYSDCDIQSALEIIEKNCLSIPGPYWSHQLPVYRIYTQEEHSQILPRLQGYLWRLKCQGIIDHALEDEIIQKLMNLEEPPNLKDIKIVASLTIFGYEQKLQDENSIGVSPYLN